jgi:hypothetical protein
LNLSTVSHIVAIPEDVSSSKTSFFQGFSTELLDEYTEIIDAISLFPNDLCELFYSQSQIIKSRRYGSSLDVYQVNTSLIDPENHPLSAPFTVIWSTKRSVKDCLKRIESFKFPPIHISTENIKHAFPLKNLTRESILKLIIDTARKNYEIFEDEESKNFMQAIINSVKIRADIDEIPFKVKTHNCVRPILKSLASIGIDTSSTEPLMGESGIGTHVNEMKKLTNFFERLFENEIELNDFRVNDRIIYCPSTYAHLYKSNSKFWNDIFREIPKDHKTVMKTMLIRNEGYGNASLEIPSSLFNGPSIVMHLIRERQKELEFYSNVVATIAASQMIPAIRLPNSVMLHHDTLRTVSDLIKRPSNKSIKNLNKKIIKYNYELKKDIGIELFDLCFKDIHKIMAIVDFPLEWITYQGIPLMFQKEISRIPSTPGNLFSHLALSGQKINITSESLRKILIIRSFSEDDKIRDHLKIALDVFSKSGSYKGMDIEFVDAANITDVVSALNEFEGMVAIFDCHGDHGGATENGWLNIGEEKLDSWDLARVARVPPIVILSACSTNAVDGSHASVANGFFRSGALSVIGTYAPIYADHAGIFVARLLYRISAFVPLVAQYKAISWREVVSGFFRMSYATDVLKGMRYDLKIITDEQYKAIHLKANTIINSGSEQWFDEWVASFDEVCSFDREKVVEILNQNFHFVSTMLFSQLGKPENIVIYDGD